MATLQALGYMCDDVSPRSELPCRIARHDGASTQKGYKLWVDSTRHRLIFVEKGRSVSPPIVNM